MTEHWKSGRVERPDLVRCEGVVQEREWDGSRHLGWLVPRPCEAVAAFEVGKGCFLCATHARVAITEFAVKSGFAKRLYDGRPKPGQGPRYLLKDPVEVSA